MPEQITALDGTFLELEDADPAAHMHIGALLVFEPLPGDPGGVPSPEELAEQIDARVDRLPRYRQRLAHPDAGRMSWQCWEEDPLFHPLRHVRRAAVVRPGGWDELLELAAIEFSRRLDRDRPLWEVVIVEGLAEGRWAMLTKTHHCLVDGVGNVEATMLLLDPERDPAPDSPPPLPPAPPPHDPPVPTALRGPLGTVRAGVHAAVHPRETAGRALQLTGFLARTEVVAAPPSALNGPIGPRRTLRAVPASLAEVKAVKNALGGKVNDVVLAAVAHGLRDLLLARGEPLPEDGLRAMVPVNVRSDEALGNRVTSLFVDLPVAEPDPLRRYEAIVAETARQKRTGARHGTDALLGAAERIPPVLHGLITRALDTTRLFNVTITNVPGPPVTLYAFGARMTDIWPLVPIAADHTLAVAIVSYEDALMFGVNADADALADADVLRDGIAAGLQTLAQRAQCGV